MKLLAHLSAEDPSEVQGFVAIFSINRNTVAIIDSDRRHDRDEINTTKHRIATEKVELGDFVWITHGREIHNYFRSNAIARAAGVPGGRSAESIPRHLRVS